MVAVAPPGAARLIVAVVDHGAYRAPVEPCDTRKQAGVHRVRPKECLVHGGTAVHETACGLPDPFARKRRARDRSNRRRRIRNRGRACSQWRLGAS